MKATVNASFAAKHQLRIDLPNGEHVRFAGMYCAAGSALHHQREVWDEGQGRAIGLEECRRLWVLGAVAAYGFSERKR